MSARAGLRRDPVGIDLREPGADLGAAAVEQVLARRRPQQRPARSASPASMAWAIAAVEIALPRRTTRSPGGAARARAPGRDRRSSARSMLRQHRMAAVRRVGAVERREQRVRAREPRGAASPVPRRPSSASHAGPLSTSSTEAQRRSSSALRVQPGEQLVAQVVGREAVVAAEARDGAVRVGAAAQRERREVEPDGPPLRPAEEQQRVVGRDVEAGEVQHLRRLAARHREVARPQVDELALRAQATDRQRGLLPRGEHELRAVGQQLGDRRDRVERLGRAHAVQVVQHEHERAADAVERAGRRRASVGRGPAPGRGGPSLEVARATGRSCRAAASGRRRPRRGRATAPAADRPAASAPAASSCRSRRARRAAPAGPASPARGGGRAGRAAAGRSAAAGARRARATSAVLSGVTLARVLEPRGRGRRLAHRQRASPRHTVTRQGGTPAYPPVCDHPRRRWCPRSRRHERRPGRRQLTSPTTPCTTR